VISESCVFTGPIIDRDDGKYADWQAQLNEGDGFGPVVVGHGGHPSNLQPEAATAGGEVVLAPTDTVGHVTGHDGPTIDSGAIIAPEIKSAANGTDHNYFQDPEIFLAGGGRRGKQLQVLTDGTFFVNRWFATIEMRPKTLIPIGYVGVVVSYYGKLGQD